MKMKSQLHNGKQIQAHIWCDLGENEEGKLQPCTFAQCVRCGHQTMSFGDGDSSETRCLALLRDECGRNESNFYVGVHGLFPGAIR
jgi:hypothetical protein